MKPIKILLVIVFFVSLLFAQDKRKVGLVPFANETGSSKYDWISFGFEYYLYSKLSVLSGFYVPEKKVFRDVLEKAGYTGGIPDERTVMHIGRYSGVEVTVSGSYKMNGNQLVLTVYYSNSFNGSLLMDATFRGPITDFFNIGRKVIDQLINLAGINVTSTEKRLLSFAFTKSITAYGSFIKAYLENEAPHPRNEMVIGLFRKAIREDPKFWEAYYNLGIVYFNTGRYQQALEQFNQVITALPNFDKPYYGRGLIFEKQKKYQKAIADFKKVIELNPNNFKAYYYLGRIEIQKKAYREAEEYLTKARKLNPEYAPIFYELGNIYYDQDRYRKCIEYYKQAVKLDDQKPLYHLKLADSYYRSQIYYNALNEVNTALSLRPDANGYFLKGITIYKQAVLEELINAFLDLLEEKPGSKKNTESDPNVLIADPVKRKKVYTDMADAFSSAIRVRPDFMEATFNLALTYHEMGDLQQAERYYLRTLQINPTLVRAHIKLAKLYTETGRKEMALEQYRKLFYIDPSLFVSNPTLGPEFHYINVFKKFRSELERQIQNEPNNPKNNLVMAKIFKAQGQYGKAANLARKVLTFSPNNQEAKKILAQIEKSSRF